ncbi:hypothetical protein [Sphingomonas faeni]|uniref:hypothetical protein n=1 Tax=Sphingomonas faeni TaxID=185950 RepID=UPI003346F99A
MTEWAMSRQETFRSETGVRMRDLGKASGRDDAWTSASPMKFHDVTDPPKPRHHLVMA